MTAHALRRRVIYDSQALRPLALRQAQDERTRRTHARPAGHGTLQELQRWLLGVKAITETNLDSGVDASGVSSKNTASITPGANQLVILAVMQFTGAGPNVPTASGNSLTYVQIATILDGGGAKRLTLFRALGASPASGAIALAFGGQTQGTIAWSVVEFNGVDTSGTDGSGAVPQSQTGTNTATSLSMTLSALGSGSASYGAFFHANNQATTAGGGYTLLHDVADATNTTRSASEWTSAGSTTVNASWASSAVNIGIAIEVKLPPSGTAVVQRIMRGVGRGIGRGVR